MQTERLTLRKWDISDSFDLFMAAKNPNVGPIAGWPIHKSVEDSKFVIENVLNGRECYAICLNGKAIGSIELKLNGTTDMTDKDDECELGFWLSEEYWGNGYMPEAAKEILKHAFLDLKMNIVWCGYYDGNSKSKRVQEKLGFKYHHTTPDIFLSIMNETRIGHVNYMTKEDYFGK